MIRQVMKYNPAFLRAEELVAQFVVRQGDLETLLRTAEENTADSNRHVLVIVHALAGGSYSVLGEYIRGQIAASRLLEGFAIDVAALFAAAENIPE